MKRSEAIMEGETLDARDYLWTPPGIKNALCSQKGFTIIIMAPKVEKILWGITLIFFWKLSVWNWFLVDNCTSYYFSRFHAGNHCPVSQCLSVPENIPKSFCTFLDFSHFLTVWLSPISYNFSLKDFLNDQKDSVHFLFKWVGVFSCKMMSMPLV